MFCLQSPSANFKQPIKGFNESFASESEKYRPTLCQKIVDQAVQNVSGNYKDLYLIHYMGDILAAHIDRALL